MGWFLNYGNNTLDNFYDVLRSDTDDINISLCINLVLVFELSFSFLSFTFISIILLTNSLRAKEKW